MTVVQRIALLLIIVIGSLAAGLSALKMQARDVKDSQALPKLEIVSSIPRYVVGRYHLGDIALLDNGDAWAVGYDGEHVRRLYCSRDRGKTWNAVDVPGSEFTLEALSFCDSQHGWAVGGRGRIIRTTNGGKSWEQMKPPTRSELQSVHFANSRVGYVAGVEKFGDKLTDEVWGSIEIFCTSDGGETWRSCYQEKQPGSVFQITAPSESEALVALDGNRLIRTDDRGTTWRLVELSGKKVFSIAMAGDGALWVVGNKGTFERSDDGGRTWRHIGSLDGDAGGRRWEQIAFNSAGMGITVGESGSLAATLDNGKSWQLLDSGIRDNLVGVRLQGSYAIIVGAQRVYSTVIGTIAQNNVR